MKNNFSFLKARWVRKRHMDGWHRRHGLLFSQTTPSVGEPIWRGRRRKGCCERNTKSAHGKRHKPSGEGASGEGAELRHRGGIALRGRSVTPFPRATAALSPGGAVLRQRDPPGRSVPAAQHGPGPAPGTNIDAALSKIKQTETHPSHRGEAAGRPADGSAVQRPGRAVPGPQRAPAEGAAPWRPPPRTEPCLAMPTASLGG